jgi:hypothetical protein
MDDPSGRTWTKKRYSSFDNSSVYKRAGQQTISSVKTGELSAVYSDELARVGPL